ncbi:MAG: hypothetical protein ACOCUS_03165 [Polyangiales bacterium]
MSGKPKDGLKAAVDATHDPAQAPVDEPGEQLGFLDEPAQSGGSPAPGGGERRGPGRPAGSRNRRTEEWVAYITQRYGAPLEELAKVMAAGPFGLRDLRGPNGEPLRDADGKPLSTIAAFHLWLQVVQTLMPYLHQKRPTAVEVSAAPPVPVEMVVSEATRALIEGAATDPDGSLKIEEDQGLGDDGAAQSDGEQSDGQR